MLTAKTHVLKKPIFQHLHAFNFSEDYPSINIPTHKIEEAFFYWKKENLFAASHFNQAEYYDRFWQLHPEYIKIIQIRDLRDVCVSCAFFQAIEIEKEIGPCCFADKLLYIISLENKPANLVLRLKKYAQLAAEWIRDPLTIVCRFEDLIGEKGGGSLVSQKEQIRTIAASLNIDLEDSRLNWIINNLFGVESGPSFQSTFREGKIGSWRNYFNEEHKKAFVKHFGEIQLNLGYNLFENEVFANPENSYAK